MKRMINLPIKSLVASLLMICAMLWPSEIIAAVPSAKIMTASAITTNPSPDLSPDDLEAEKAKLQQGLEYSWYELMTIYKELKEKATEEEAPELYSKWERLSAVLNDVAQRIDNASTEEEIAVCRALLEQIAKELTDFRKEVEAFDPTPSQVAIDETNFPDENFRKYLLSQSYGEDGILTKSEIDGITSLLAPTPNIENLKGIEFFTALESFYCAGNKLTSLDMSQNVALLELWCNLNQLTSLDVSKNHNLRKLYCNGNQLTTLDLSANTALQELWCHDNHFEGDAMDNLIAHLPVVESGKMMVIYSETDGNSCSPAQVSAAKAKGWTAYRYDGANWVEMEGSGLIDFADANVKAICVENWDTDGDGELSFLEAASVTDFGKAFNQNSEITLFPEFKYFTGLTSIPDSAFYHCTKLKDIDIPDQVTSIGKWAFYNCPLKINFKLPNSLKIIEYGAFNSTGIGDCVFPEGLEEIGDWSFNWCNFDSLSLPSTLIRLGYGSFGHNDLRTVTIPASVKKIGHEPFMNNHNLEAIVVEEGNTNYSSPNNCNAIIDYRMSLVQGCNTSIIPEGVNYLEWGAFEGMSNLEKIDIPEGVTGMGSFVFHTCISLKEISIPSTLKGTLKDVFYYCKDLKTIRCYIREPNAITTSFIGYNPEGFYEQATLFVPAGTKAKYEVTEGWNLFQNIVEMEEEVHDLCPDDNHPHMIDLGLPSGTKWACCNVDAETPEAYGGYYAWGETEEKELYDWSTYIHCDGTEETCHNIGSDIAGTEYDVAHVKWGGAWKMPTQIQVRELRDNCTWEWTTVNSINGLKITGPNGNFIFLPAAGGRWDDGPGLAGSRGLYWSSTVVSQYAFVLLFESDGASWANNACLHYCGFTVRPVLTSEQSIDPLDEDETVTFDDEDSGIDEDADLAGNVIGDIFYNITAGNGSYNATEGCITVTKPTSDEQMQAMDGEDIFGEDFKSQFTGIVFMVPAGSGTVKVTAQTTGNMVLKVKIGNNAPIEMELEGKLKASFPYNVTDESYVYIYAGENNAAGVKGLNAAYDDASSGELKVYGIELKVNQDGIRSMENGKWKMNNVIYNLSGQRLTKPQRGVNIVDGKKVVVK